MLDWYGLEVFVIAARLQNFSAAAQQLQLSQPAVTQRIQNLEQYLGVALFERKGRRVFLSETGSFLLPMAEDLLRRGKRLEEMMHSLSGQVVGHLILACSTTSGKYILPNLLARFRLQHPGVSATVKVGSRQCMLELLLSRGAQLAFTSARVEHQEIIYSRFFEDEIVLIVPAGHEWVNRPFIEPQDLLNARLITREEPSGTCTAVAQSLETVDISLRELRTVMTLGNSEAIIMAVEEGIGVGFVPKTAADRYRPMGQLQIVPINGLYIKHTIWMAENSLQPATPAQIHFQEMLNTISLDAPPEPGIPVQLFQPDQPLPAPNQ